MSRKVMLIMDEPLDCTDCPLTDLSSMTGDKLCLASNMRWIETQNEYKKPDWCPLKPMPTKKKPLFDPDHCDIEEEIKIVHEIVGYNRCIDEIMGETE